MKIFPVILQLLLCCNVCNIAKASSSAPSQWPPCPASGYKHNCFGEMITAAGKFTGEFKNNQWDGQGTYTSPGGHIYIGEFSAGRLQGYGSLTSNEGAKYVGQVKEDQPCGLGTYTQLDGARYVGEFRDFLPHGKGVRYKGNEVVGEGVFEKGKLVRSESVAHLVIPAVLAVDAAAQLANAEREQAHVLAAERHAAELANAEMLSREREANRVAAIAAAFSGMTERATQGASEAQYRLAQMYFSGTGTSVDDKAGMLWLLKAAGSGFADAQYELGERYRTGLLIAHDNVKAEMWFRKATQQGHADTVGGFAALLAEKQARANAVADAAKKRDEAVAAAARRREEAIAEAARRQEDERAELARKAKLDNAAKLKAL